MAKLSEVTRKNLIVNAKEVFFGYLRLELLNHHKLMIDGKEKTIAQHVNEGNTHFVIKLGKREVQISVQDNKLVFTDNNANPAKEVKGLKEYSDEEIADHLNGSFITQGKHPEMTFSNEITNQQSKETYLLAGPGMLDLYSLHISNLGQIIEHLESKEFDTNMLVSLTTGSGKTFTQGLWMMVLHMSKVNGIFAVPGKLVDQYKDDLKRLIPKKMLDEIQPNSPSKKGIIIDSVDAILLERFDELMQLPPDKTLFSFDEAHLIARKENKFVKAKALATKFVNLFLTATPTPALYEIAKGNNKKGKLTVVATMSNEQKVKNDYAERTSSYSAPTKSIREMGKKIKLSFTNKLGRKLADAIDPQTGFNAANAFGEAYLYNLSEKQTFDGSKISYPAELEEHEKLRLAARWRLQPSAFQNKTLICANHFDDIVNFDSFLNHMTGQEIVKNDGKLPVPSFPKDFYTHGNKFNRDQTYQFLQMNETIDGKETNVDMQIYDDYAKNLHDQFKNELTAKVDQLTTDLNITDEKNLFQKDLVSSMMRGLPYAPITNSMHGVVDLTLSFLAARAAGKEPHLNTLMQEFGGAYLDKHRFTNLKDFAKKISGACSNLNQDDLIKFLVYDENNNPKGIAPQLAAELAPIMLKIVEANSEHDKYSIRIVDNWYADQTVFELLNNRDNPDNSKMLSSFAKNHYKQFVFEHIEKNETITTNEVFSSFAEKEHVIGIDKANDNTNDDDSNYKPKPRSKRAVEALDPKSKESVYTPQSKNPEGYNPAQQIEMTDNLFRLGITSIYATDKKIEGFNDPNLHQVAVVANSNENTLANPENLIQAYGRNRGLNKYKVPNFFLVTQKGVKCVFGVKELNKADYQKDYDQSILKFKKEYIKKLGQELGDDILKWIETNKDVFHQVDDEKLSEEVIDYCFNTLEKINQANAFKYKLTQKDYEKVLTISINHLKKKQADLKKGSTLSLLVRVVGILVHNLAKIYRRLATREPRKQLNLIEKRLKSLDKNQLDGDDKIALLHIKITKIPLETVWKHDLARNIILMNVFNEARAVHEIRDKYYSALFLKPLNVLSADDKHQIKENYPELKILLEGMCSYIALTHVEDKENYILRTARALSSNNMDEIQRIYQELQPLAMNEKHPDKKTHLERLKKMLEVTGTASDEIPSDFNQVINCIKGDNHFELKIALITKNNQSGLIYLEPSEERAMEYLQDVKKLLVKDIKKLASPLLSDPAFKDALRFIQDNFKEDLGTFLGGDMVDGPTAETIAFITDVINRSDDDWFYEKYFLPSDEKLSSGNFSDEDLKIKDALAHIDFIFGKIHESNLKFFKITERGEAKAPTPNDGSFFQNKDPTNPILKIVVDGYSIRLGTPPADQLAENKLTIFLDINNNEVNNLWQINAEGESVQLLLTKENKQILNNMKLKDKIEQNKKYPLEYNDLEKLNTAITSATHANNDEKHGETIFSPALNDQNTDQGKSWRQVFGLNSLKTALPTINRVTYKVKGEELNKAVEVSTKVLKGIKNKKITKTSDSLLVHASIFSQVLRDEARAKHKTAEDVLDKKESRVEKMKGMFSEQKKEYDNRKITDSTKVELNNKLVGYISSRAKLRQTEKGYAITSLKSKLFFDDGLTTEKVNLALNLLKKLTKNKMGDNYHETLKLIEKTIVDNKKLMIKYGKNPSSTNDLNTVLTAMKENLVENRFAASRAGWSGS